MSYSVRYTRKEFEVARYYEVRCDGCQGELQPEAPAGPDGSWESLAAQGALRIRLISAFGGFFDSHQNHDPVVLLCHDCAERLLAAFPGIAELIRHVDDLPDEVGSPLGVSLRPIQPELRTAPRDPDEEW